MITDHIGIAFLSDNGIYYDYARALGRFTFIAFVFVMAVNLKHNKNIGKYLKHLFIFGLISIIPFILLFKIFELNVFFQLFACVLTYSCIYYGKTISQTEEGGMLNRILKNHYLSALAFIFALILSHNSDYGLLGLIFFLLVEKLFSTNWHTSVKIFLFTLLSIIVNYKPVLYSLATDIWHIYIGAIAISVCLIVLLYQNHNRIKIKFKRNKWFFYWFYPVHIIMLFALQYWGIFA